MTRYTTPSVLHQLVEQRTGVDAMPRAESKHMQNLTAVPYVATLPHREKYRRREDECTYVRTLRTKVRAYVVTSVRTYVYVRTYVHAFSNSHRPVRVCVHERAPVQAYVKGTRTLNVHMRTSAWAERRARKQPRMYGRASKVCSHTRDARAKTQRKNASRAGVGACQSLCVRHCDLLFYERPKATYDA